MSNEVLKSTIVAQEKRQSPVQLLKKMMETHKNELIMALPKHISADRVVRLTCTQLSSNKALQKCTTQSIFGAVIQACQVGLDLGVMGQAYLIPYKDTCQFIPGYKGLIALARRSGEITSIETNIVYSNDKFSLKLGIETEVSHEPHLDGDRGIIRLVYGVAKFKDGGHHFEWMSKGDVDSIRDNSNGYKFDTYKKSPWRTHYEQMMRKTLIRRMSNYLPMSTELQTAIQVSDAVEADKKFDIEGGVVVIQENDAETGEAE